MSHLLAVRILRALTLLSFLFAAGSNATPTPLTIMTYNTQLFDSGAIFFHCKTAKEIISNIGRAVCESQNLAPLDHDDIERAHLIGKSILQTSHRPDIVALQEVWTDDVRDILLKILSAEYPYSYRPDPPVSAWRQKFVGSGLLLMSKYPIVQHSSQFEPYRIATGQSEYATKGIGRVTVRLWPNTKIGVFFTHTAGEDDNLCQLLAAIKNYQREHPTHGILVAGDLNTNENAATFFAQCENEATQTQSLKLVDTFRAIYPDAKTANGKSSIRKEPERIDYIFYWGPGIFKQTRAAAIDEPIFYFHRLRTHQKEPLSDHFPLFAQIEMEVAKN